MIPQIANAYPAGYILTLVSFVIQPNDFAEMNGAIPLTTIVSMKDIELIICWLVIAFWSNDLYSDMSCIYFWSSSNSIYYILYFSVQVEY